MLTLHIFDFDDTLIKSKSLIHVKQICGNNFSLNSKQFAEYKPAKDDIFDFSEFDCYPKSAKIIKQVFNVFETVIDQHGKQSVTVVTSRSNSDPVKNFLADQGILGINVIALGSTNPKDKAEYVKRRLNRRNFEFVKLFEDNVMNIKYIKEIALDLGVRIQTNRIKHSNDCRKRPVIIKRTYKKK
jgi:hypothetical protein